mmetsp:Transcript_10652/g.32032  ORF Transcript_10652/g.32032 Transcript_10652/m.32032 type:complete len:328 (-) Transcript_10652:52-1035(-)
MEEVLVSRPRVESRLQREKRSTGKRHARGQTGTQHAKHETTTKEKESLGGGGGGPRTAAWGSTTGRVHSSSSRRRRRDVVVVGGELGAADRTGVVFREPPGDGLAVKDVAARQGGGLFADDEGLLLDGALPARSDVFFGDVDGLAQLRDRFLRGRRRRARRVRRHQLLDDRAQAPEGVVPERRRARRAQQRLQRTEQLDAALAPREERTAPALALCARHDLLDRRHQLRRRLLPLLGLSTSLLLCRRRRRRRRGCCGRVALVCGEKVREVAVLFRRHLDERSVAHVTLELLRLAVQRRPDAPSARVAEALARRRHGPLRRRRRMCRP